MPKAKHPSKRTLDMIARQQKMMENVNAALARLAPVVSEIEEEGIRLDYLESEHERTKLRGENPDPIALARVHAEKAAFLLRCEKLNALMAEMSKQADAIIQTANEGLFEALCRQFNAQFNTREGL